MYFKISILLFFPTALTGKSRGNQAVVLLMILNHLLELDLEHTKISYHSKFQKEIFKSFDLECMWPPYLRMTPMTSAEIWE